MSEDEHKQKKIKAEDDETPEGLARRRDAAHEKLVVIGKELHDVRKAARGLCDKLEREILDGVAVKGARPPIFVAEIRNDQLAIMYMTDEKKPRAYRKTYTFSDGASTCIKTEKGVDCGEFDRDPVKSPYCDRFAEAVAKRMTEDKRKELACLRRAMD